MNTFAKNIEIRGNVTSGMDRILNTPRCRVLQTAAQTFSTGNPIAILFDNATPNLDTDGFFNTSTLNRITIRTAGFYDVKANISWQFSAGGATRLAWLQKNGVTTARYGSMFMPPTGGIVNCNIAYSIAMDAGDYLELAGFQDTGVNLSTSTNTGLHPSAEIILCLIST